MRLQNLNTQFLGRNIVFYPKIDSTQLELWRRIGKNEIDNGTIILAELQTNGKRNTWTKMDNKTKE